MFRTNRRAGGNEREIRVHPFYGDVVVIVVVVVGVVFVVGIVIIVGTVFIVIVIVIIVVIVINAVFGVRSRRISGCPVINSFTSI